MNRNTLGTASTPKWSFGTRAIFAATAGLAFTSFIVAWAVKTDTSLESVLAVCFWGVTSNLGIFIAARNRRSLLLGSLIGGSLAALASYVALMALNPMPATIADHAFGIVYVLCLAGTASGLLASIVGTLLNGFRLRAHKDRSS